MGVKLERYVGKKRTTFRLRVNANGKTDAIKVPELKGLYIINDPKTPSERERNNVTKRVVDEIVAKKNLEYSGNKHLIALATSKLMFFDVFEDVIKTKTVSTQKPYRVSFNAIKSVTDDFKLKDLNKQKVYEIEKALLKPRKGLKTRKVSTVNLYISRIVNVAIHATREDLIPTNPLMYLKRKKVVNESIEDKYYSVEEFRILKANLYQHPDNPLHEAPTPTEIARRKLWLFGCFVGLRIDDLKKLTYGNITKTDECSRLSVFSGKTKKNLELLLIQDALDLLPDATSDSATARRTERIFKKASNEWKVNNQLSAWVSACGIKQQDGTEKRMTYHRARHTCACLCANSGIPLEKVQSWLGHNSIVMTRIYAKFSTRSMDEAMQRLNNI